MELEENIVQLQENILVRLKETRTRLTIQVYLVQLQENFLVRLEEIRTRLTIQV